MTDSTMENRADTQQDNELPPAPEGFSFKQDTYTVNGKSTDTFEVKWMGTDGKLHSARFLKKVPLGKRISAMEAFGEQVTAEGRVGFLAAISAVNLDAIPEAPARSKSELLDFLDRLDDVGLMAWMRAKAEIAKSSDEQAEAAKVKATVGN